MRTVIADDEALLREGLTLVLSQAGFEVVGAAGGADELVELTRRLEPDLVVTDIRMPPDFTDEGLRAGRELRRDRPELPIMVLSQHLQRQHVTDLLACPSGGIGYLLKQRIADIPTFCSDLKRVCAGGTVLDPEVVALMVNRPRGDRGGLDRLTRRQIEVLSLMAAGRSNGAIARSLAISNKAVVQHVSHIYDALGIPESTDDHRRVLAVVRYLQA